jgi:hypothetical protein
MMRNRNSFLLPQQNDPINVLEGDPIHMIPAACHHESDAIPKKQLPPREQLSMRDHTGSQNISLEQPQLQSGCKPKIKSVCDMSDLLQVLDSIVPSKHDHQHLQFSEVTREFEQTAVDVTSVAKQISPNEVTSTKTSCSERNGRCT